MKISYKNIAFKNQTDSTNILWKSITGWSGKEYWARSQKQSFISGPKILSVWSRMNTNKFATSYRVQS